MFTPNKKKDEEAEEPYARHFLIAGVVFFAALSAVWIYFFRQWGVTFRTLFTLLSSIGSLNMTSLYSLLMNENLTFIIILFPLSTAFLGAFASRVHSLRDSIILGAAGSGIAFASGFLYFSSLNYMIVGGFFVIGSVVSSVSTFNWTDETKKVHNLGSGWKTTGKIVVFLAIGTLIASYLDVNSNYSDYSSDLLDTVYDVIERYMGTIESSFSDPAGFIEQQLRDPSTKAMMISLFNQSSSQMMNALANNPEMINSTVQSMITVESVSGVISSAIPPEFAGIVNPDTLAAALVPTLREQMAGTLTDYLSQNADQISAALTEGIDQNYDSIVASIVEQIPSDLGGISSMAENQIKSMISNMLTTGELGQLMQQILPWAVAIILSSWIMVLSPVFSAVSAIYSMFISIILKRIAPLEFVVIVRRVGKK